MNVWNERAPCSDSASTVSHISQGQTCHSHSSPFPTCVSGGGAVMGGKAYYASGLDIRVTTMGVIIPTLLVKIMGFRKNSHLCI